MGLWEKNQKDEAIVQGLVNAMDKYHQIQLEGASRSERRPSEPQVQVTYYENGLSSVQYVTGEIISIAIRLLGQNQKGYGIIGSIDHHLRGRQYLPVQQGVKDPREKRGVEESRGIVMDT